MKKTIILLWAFILLSLPSFSQDSSQTCNCYYPFDTITFQPVPLTMGPDSTGPPYYKCGSNSSQAIKLPFKFCFYGTSYDTVYIGNKGIISFVKPIYDFTTGNFPAGKDTLMIAPFWANINNIPFGTRPPGVGETWYKVYPDHLVVNWVFSCYYSFDPDLYDSFKLTISDGKSPVIPGGNNVEFCYRDSAMQWASADSSGGSMGFNGVPATVGVNKGDGSSYAILSRFSLPGLTFYGPQAANNGLYWLEGKSFILNTCVTEKNIPPVIVQADECDTFDVCRWDSLQYSVYFLCAEQGQKATLSVSAPGLSGIVSDTASNSNGMSKILFKAGIGDAAPGYHTINVTATDNSTPPQTSTYPVVVNVGICTGINEVSNNSKFSVYPNANKGRFTVELDNSLVPTDCVLKIVSITGEEIYSAPLAAVQNSIDISDVAAGMYFVEVYKQNSLLGVKKIVIQ